MLGFCEKVAFALAFSSQDNVLLADKRPHGLVVQDALRQPAPPAGRAEAHRCQVSVESVTAMNLQVLGQVI